MKKIFFLLILVKGLFAAEIPVNINDDVYDFLQRMENKQVIELNSAIFPYNRNKIASILNRIDDSRSLLSKSDQSLLDEYLSDFRLELKERQHDNLKPNDDGLLAPLFT